MEGNIKIIADLALNLFYGDYANGAEFLDADDFIYYAGLSYTDLLGQEYQIMYNQMRADGDENVIEFSHDWLKTEVIKREKDNEGYYVKLSEQVCSFPYDKRDVGIQNVFPVGGKFKNEVIRSSISSIWQDSYLPLTKNVFWGLLEDRIYFSSNLVDPAPEYRIVYVPGVSDNLQIPASRQKMVIDNTIKLVKESLRGTIIKETNNQNLNVAPVTEADQNLIKQ